MNLKSITKIPKSASLAVYYCVGVTGNRGCVPQSIAEYLHTLRRSIYTEGGRGRVRPSSGRSERSDRQCDSAFPGQVVCVGWRAETLVYLPQAVGSVGWMSPAMLKALATTRNVLERESARKNGMEGRGTLTRVVE